MARFGRAQPAPPFFGRRIVAPGTLTLLDFAANTGAGQGGVSGVYVNILNAAGVQVALLPGYTISGGHDLVISDGLIAAGSFYHGYVFTLTGAGTMLQGVFQATAT